MSWSGLVDHNAATGQDARVSSREAELDLRGGKTDSGTSLRLRKRDVGKDAKKRSLRHPAAREADIKNTAFADTQQAIVPDTPELTDMPPGFQGVGGELGCAQAASSADGNIDSELPEQHGIRTEELAETADSKAVRQGRSNDKTPPQKIEYPTTTTQTAREHSPLKHDDSRQLQFAKDEAATLQPSPKQRGNTTVRGKTATRQPEPVATLDRAASESVATPTDIANTFVPPVKESGVTSSLDHAVPDRLRIMLEQGEALTATPTNFRRNAAPKQAAQPVADAEPAAAIVDGQQQETPPFSTSLMPNEIEIDKSPLKHDKADATHSRETDSTLQMDKADSTLATDRAESLPKSDKPGKLQFTADEASPVNAASGEIKQGRILAKAQTKADRAISKLEKAKGELPSKKKLAAKRVFNEQTGKSKTKLHFESEAKPQGEHIKGAKLLRPVKAAGNTLMLNAHRKIYQVEDENVAIKAAHRSEMAAEIGVRSALRFHKAAAPYRKVAKLERAAQKKSVRLTFQKARGKSEIPEQHHHKDYPEAQNQEGLCNSSPRDEKRGAKRQKSRHSHRQGKPVHVHVRQAPPNRDGGCCHRRAAALRSHVPLRRAWRRGRRRA